MMENDVGVSCPINVLAVFTESRNSREGDMKKPQQKLVIAVQSKTKTVENDMLRDRELKRIEQLKINAEIRRRSLQAEQSYSGRQNNE
jgi:hypothetical protein